MLKIILDIYASNIFRDYHTINGGRIGSLIIIKRKYSNNTARLDASNPSTLHQNNGVVPSMSCVYFLAHRHAGGLAARYRRNTGNS